MHVNHRDEAFLRVGDRSKKLTFDERMELMYSKGMRFYEDEPVYRSTLDDIDMEFVAKYCEKIGYGKTPEEYIRQNNEAEQRVIEYLSQNSNITIKELVEISGYSDGYIRKILTSLKTKKIIERQGGNKTGKWIVVNRAFLSKME